MSSCRIWATLGVLCLVACDGPESTDGMGGGQTSGPGGSMSSAQGGQSSTGGGVPAGSGGGVASGGTGGNGVGGGAGGELPVTDCTLTHVLCAGGGAEFETLQSAAAAAVAGDTVVGLAGHHAGFQIDTSGTMAAPVLFYGEPGAIIDSDGPTGDGIRLQNVSDVHIRGFQITGMTERCIAARGATPTEPMHRISIRGVTCDRAGHEGFYLSEVATSLIEGNSITQSGQDGQPRGHGIYLANAGADNTTIRRNHIFDIDAAESAGIHFNGDASVGGDGIISGLIVDGNIIHGLGHNALNMDGVQDSRIQNNVIYDVRAHAIRGYAIDATSGPRDLVIVNNTVDLPATGRAALKLTEDLGGHLVWNNILLTASTSSGSIMVEGASNLESRNNAVVNRFSLDGDTLVSLTAWQALGLDQGSFQATTSLFVSPGSDYRLTPGAGAIDIGLALLGSVQAPDEDADRGVRPRGQGFDIGAYEVQP